MGGWVCVCVCVCVFSMHKQNSSCPCANHVSKILVTHFRTPVSNLATTLLRMSRKLPWWALESVHRGSKRKWRLPPFRNSCWDSGGSSCRSGCEVTHWPLAARQLMIWCLVGRREGEEEVGEEGDTSYW